MTPIEALLGWFDKLAIELRQDIAALVLAALPTPLLDAEPDRDEGLAAREDPSKFGERLRRWGDGASARHVGIVVAVAGLIDLIVMTRDSRDDWDDIRVFWEHIQDEPEIGDIAKQSLEQIPLRARRWIQAAKDWNELRRAALSPVELNAWWRTPR